MTQKPLLIFDFDGVIIDGLSEYWDSSRKACLNLLGEKSHPNLPNNIPKAFEYLRPWVKQGWEMVLIAAELTRYNSLLLPENYKIFSENYTQRCKEALEIWQWNPSQLQRELDNIRKAEINNNVQSWLKNHKSFPGVPNRINRLSEEGLELVILTTKSSEFTTKLLNLLEINVKLIFGHESGSKSDVLIELSKSRTIKGFIEDRRATLEKIINHPQLSSIPCFLASWGYLKPNDLKNLPNGIHLLDLKTFSSPLANWN